MQVVAGVLMGFERSAYVADLRAGGGSRTESRPEAAYGPDRGQAGRASRSAYPLGIRTRMNGVKCRRSGPGARCSDRSVNLARAAALSYGATAEQGLGLPSGHLQTRARRPGVCSFIRTISL